MSQNITWLGASYSNVPAVTLPKTGGGTARFTDVTDTTAAAGDVASGKYFFTASGVLTLGTASGGGGDGYILTTVCPQQTVTPDSSTRRANLANFTTGLVDGDFYLVTYDGTQYVCTCGLLWGNNLLLGDQAVFFQTTDVDKPFCIDWVSASETEVVCTTTTSHTVKVEHMELVSPTVLTTKTITTNGTYSAEDDSANGYSSVTVNVSGGGGGNYQAKTNINPTTSSQTIRPDSGYDALSSVQINAMPSGTAGTPSATKGSVSNHSVSVTPSVTNTTGYITGGTKTGTAVTVSASELVSGSETKTANGTYDVTNLAQLVVNVSSGSSKNVQVAQSTSRATSSTYTSVCSLTCSTAGTYDVYWNCFRSSTGGTSGSRLYVGGSAYGSANTSFTNHAQTNHLTGVSISKNQTVAVYARSRGSNYYAYCGQLTIVQTA